MAKFSCEVVTWSDVVVCSMVVFPSAVIIAFAFGSNFSVNTP